MVVEVLVEYEDGTIDKKTVYKTNDRNSEIVRQVKEDLKSVKPSRRVVARAEGHPNFGKGFVD